MIGMIATSSPITIALNSSRRKILIVKNAAKTIRKNAVIHRSEACLAPHGIFGSEAEFKLYQQ